MSVTVLRCGWALTSVPLQEVPLWRGSKTPFLTKFSQRSDDLVAPNPKAPANFSSFPHQFLAAPVSGRESKRPLKMKSVISKHNNRGEKSNKSNNLKQQRTKRNRAANITAKRVIATGEQPSDRVMKNGKLRHLDLAAKGHDDHHIPRKTREFMARMNKWKSPSSGSSPLEGQDGKTSIANIAVPSLNAPESKTKRDFRKHFSHQNGSGDGAEQSMTDPASEERANGRKPGESVADCTARLKNESKQMAIDLARAGNHQREKRKAYHKKRRERLQRRKRRRRGEYSDSEVEDDDNFDDENAQRISHLPGYWQEIVRNNGRPLSAKKRRRLDRLETEAAAKRRFGDQVERPPDLTVLPVRRSKATDVRAG